jgi:hypothetical protein
MAIHRTLLRILVPLSFALLVACVHVDSKVELSSQKAYPPATRVGLVLAADSAAKTSIPLSGLAACVNQAAAARGVPLEARAYPSRLATDGNLNPEEALAQQLRADHISWLHVIRTGEQKRSVPGIEASGEAFAVGATLIRTLSVDDSVMMQSERLHPVGHIGVSADSEGAIMVGLAFIFPAIGVVPRMAVDKPICREFGNAVIDFHLEAQTPRLPDEADRVSPVHTEVE